MGGLRSINASRFREQSPIEEASTKYRLPKPGRRWIIHTQPLSASGRNTARSCENRRSRPIHSETLNS
jgi:hypothetical protein